MSGEDEAIVCPRCARPHPTSERFCEHCSMPLVHGSGEQAQASGRRVKARKIKPEYADGPLVKVAAAGNQIEAEFLAGLLLEEGIPAVARTSSAGYAPVLGVRELLVPESGAQAAREVLLADRPGADV
jgi:hypothetical protein